MKSHAERCVESNCQMCRHIVWTMIIMRNIISNLWVIWLMYPHNVLHFFFSAPIG